MFDKQLIEETLNYAKTKGAEFAEAFCEQTTSVATALDEKESILDRVEPQTALGFV